MNNSNFKKKLSGLKPITPSVCVGFVGKLGDGGRNIEREVRFGNFRGGRFTPGVTDRQFKAVLDNFSNLPQTRTVDTVTSRTLSQKQNIRRIVSNNGKDIYQLKEKLNTIDVPSEGVRLSRARELTMDIFKDEYNKLPSRGQYTQTRERISFKKGTIQIDCTKLPGNKYQVEIEFENKSEVCRYIKTINDILENVKITGIVFAQYRDLVKGPRFIGPLPQTLTLEAFKKKVLTKTNYSVTEKADGERFLLFIDNVGGFNLIARNMNITHLDTELYSKPDFAGTIMDGELVNGMYYAFDISFVQGTDIRSKKLIERLTILLKVLEDMKVRILKMKSFLIEHNNGIIEMPANITTPVKNIYEAARALWDRRSVFPYSLDGLIFTPADEGKVLSIDSSGNLVWIAR